jgi:aminopeptidase N
MDYSGIGLDFDFIIIHETGHEWWGNAVSVEDLADLWIHEGFCTYSEVLYVECLYGKEKALDYINFAKTRIQNEKPLIPNYGVNAQGPGDIYTKGAMLIHNIRYIVNDDEKFLGWIRAIVDTFSYKTTNTNELIKFSNSFFKQDLTILFNEFLQFPQLPVLQYKLNKKGNKFSYKWMANQPEFNMPINVNFSDTRLIPINKWKSLKIRQMDVGNVKVDQRNSYFNVELIN